MGSEKMILTIDVGNTNINVGAFKDENVSLFQVSAPKN